MSQPSADRNLLFGILALQMDFISRDALIAAMNAWLLQKHRSLGEVLEERGALDPADRSLLEPLVRRHIEQHGDDPAQSLASLSSVEWIRGALAGVERADPEVRGSLDRLRTDRHEGRADPEATAVHAGKPDASGPRFRIVRFHARGGLGEVFVAEDAELHRQVALKRIQDRHGDHPESRSRFLLEAEITGGLEHPGIVPVYGLGHYDNGRPFYAMRFIKGDSLKEAIARFHGGGDGGERMLALQKLLRRFLDVCNAVAYAHSRGVLHRDIKPGNIMVGQYGETLVVDWGLAKLVGKPEPSDEATLRPPSASGTGETLPGSAIGTPGFMSPEQAEGRLDRLGPASDVYSLGATLYSLLTGRPPVEGSDLEDVIRRVRQGEIPPPSQVAPDVPRALEAICLKAMAREPEGRYPTPRALADDIERWMADEPVSAWREPFSARARRWMRRHRTLVTSAAAVVLAGLVALGIAYLRESEFSRKLLAANAALEEANTREKDARAESDRRLEQTFRAIDDYYTGVGQEILLGQKEFKELRARLLEKPRQFYEQLAKEIESNPAADERSRSLLARGRNGLGRIYQAIDRLDDARTQYEAGIALLEQLVRDRPALAEYRSLLARTRSNLGVLQTSAADHRAAMENLRQAIALLTRISEDGPDASTNQAALGIAYTNLGLEQEATGAHAEALESHRRAIEIYRRLTAAHPDVADYQDGLAKGLHNLGLSQRALGELPAALTSYREAIAIRSRLAAERPDVPEYRHLLATTHGNVGHVRQSLGDHRGMIDSYSKAIAIWDGLATAQPNVPIYQSRLAAAHNGLGIAHSQAGDGRRAIESFGQSIAIYTRLAESRYKIPEYEGGLARTLNNLGFAMARAGDLSGAEASYRQAITAWKRLAAAHPEVPNYQKELVMTYNNIGDVQKSAGDHPGAMETRRLANAGALQLVRAHPGVPEYQDQLASSYNNLAGSQLRADDLRAAMESYRQAIAIQSRLTEDSPNVPAFRLGLVNSYSNLGLAQNAAGDIAGAIETHRKASTLASRFVEAFPESLDARSLRGLVLHNLAESLYDAGRLRESEQAYRQAADSQREALKRAPQLAKARFYLNGHHKGLSKALRSLGEGDEAARITRERLGLAGHDPDELYQAACELALCMPLVGDESRKQALAGEAVTNLKAAVAAGWKGAAHIKSEPALDPLRDRDDFRRLVDGLWDRAFPADPFAR